MYELPPMLRGSEGEQIAALRDYLVRLARSLETPGETALTPAADRIAAGTETARLAAESEQVRQRAAELRALIVKTADVIEREVEVLNRTLREDYLARSDFGTYQESIRTVFESTAREVVESYDFAAALEALDRDGQALLNALTAIRGEIRRGLITDPETGETGMGIAIAEELRFTGQERTENGLTYYELSPGQTLGLYTATGWQFWINGSKRGWFNSVDGMLHVTNLSVEQSLALGGGWEVTMANGLGVRYLG